MCSDSSDGEYSELDSAHREDRDTRYRDQVVLRYKKGFGPDGEVNDDHMTVHALNEIDFIAKS